MDREIAIQISGLKKMYKLGQIGGGTLQGDLQSWWARIRGKEDPNSKIGSDQRSNGKTFMALNGIDLTVYKGEALGIIGHNGAGKSTLLKLLSRVTAPTGGTIDIHGRIASMLEVGTGFNGEMTGRENVYMNGAILGMTRAEVDAKMEQIIEFSEVREFIDTPVKRYSSGMYVKLAFSVAAHLDSEIMIMDEVLAVGDMAFQKKCLDKMRQTATQEGRTVLYVSHNMNTIRQLCDRCVVLDQGRVVFEGDVEEAIGVYMGRGQSDSAFFDLSNSRMKHLPSEVLLKMTSLSLVGKDAPIYSKKEKIVFQLGLHGYKAMRDIRFRFEIRYADDTPVGTSFGAYLDGVEANEDKLLLVEFNAKDLTVGRYRVCLVAYVQNSYGGYDDLDAVWPAFTFEIIDESDIRWNSHGWGHVHFDDLEVKAV